MNAVVGSPEWCAEVKAAAQAVAAGAELEKAISAFERAGYGSHVTEPLRDALKNVNWSIQQVTA